MDEDEPAEPSPLARIRQHHPSIQRRRDLASSLNFPARGTFGKFTDSQRAVLKIMSGEVVKHGACTLTKDAIADKWLPLIQHADALDGSVDALCNGGQFQRAVDEAGSPR